MPKEEMSVLDAFMALEDINDEEIEKSLNESKQKRNLTEGKGFNVRDINEMEKAEDFVNQDTKKDVALEVIDVDADSLEHLKKNDEYIGQMILQCNSCKANRFINAEDLVQSEGDDDVYNIEDECPHCHGTGTGFHLIGQVGKVTDEEDEVKFDNDSLTDEEPKLDNEPEEEPVEDENATEETEEDNEEDFTSEEDNGLETDAEDDTADMESTLGDEFDSDDVKYDDTEEEPTKEEDSLTNNDEDKYDEPLTPVEEPEDEDKKKEKKESVEEAIDTTLSSVHDLFENIIEPENISLIEIYDLDSDEPDEPVFKGDYNELPESFLNSEVAEFNVDSGLLIVNIDTEAEIDELTPTVKTALDIFGDDFNDNISVWDQAAGNELFSGTKESVIEEFGHNAFLSFEAPEVLQIFARNVTVEEGLKTPYKEDLDLAEPSDKLISDIIEENGLRETRIDKYGTDEYWIADSIRNLEDLDFIYTNYIQNKSTNLQLEFKDVTGYGSEPDYDEDGNIIEEKLDSEEDVRKEAEQALKNNNAEAVIYGYLSNGKFKRVEGDFLIINTDKELGLATELVKAKYKPTGSVKVVYKNDVAEALDFKNRKELKEAILDCDNKGISYQIKRSTKEGYRYTLLKESPDPTEIENTEEDDLDDLEDLDIEIEEPVENNKTVEDLQIKLEEIANNIASTVAEKYNATIDESAILNDMVNDLCISLRMEELGERSNEEFLAELSQEEINAAFDQLNNPEFSNESIKERIADPLFAAAIEAGEIPGVTLNDTPVEEPDVNDIPQLTTDDMNGDQEYESLNEENLYTKLLAKSKKYKGIDPATKEDEANESLNEEKSNLNKVQKEILRHLKERFDDEYYDLADSDNLNELKDTKELAFHIWDEDMTDFVIPRKWCIEHNEDYYNVSTEAVEDYFDECIWDNNLEDSLKKAVEDYFSSLNESLKEDINPKPLNKDKAQLILSNNFYQNDKIDKTEYDNLLDLLDNDENSFSKRLVELGIKNEFFKDYNEHIEETLDEAKKDDELPADPEVVKTNVHATLNNLVTDEIEAINGYEEAKAEIADTHIEHKDDIIDTIDHIEDEEQEHIDELIDAASEIPFEKDGHEEVKEEPIEEPEIEEEPELEPEDEESFELAVPEEEVVEEDLKEGKHEYTIVYEVKGDNDYHYFDGNDEEKIQKDFIKYVNDNGIELVSAELCTNDNEGNPESPAIYTFKIEHNQVVESLNEANSRIKVKKYKQKDGCKIQLVHTASGFGSAVGDDKDSAKAAEDEMEKEIDDILKQNNLTKDDVEIKYTREPNKGYLIADIKINESLNESVDIHIEGNDVTIADNSGEDVAIIPIDPEGEEAPEDETSEEEPSEDEENSEEVNQEFDEKKFENFINEWLDNNLEETQLFETTNGFIKEDNTIVLEGIMHLEDNKDETASFTLTPKTNLEESVENEIVYENYTVTLNK